MNAEKNLKIKCQEIKAFTHVLRFESTVLFSAPYRKTLKRLIGGVLDQTSQIESSVSFYPHWIRLVRLYHIFALTRGVRAFGLEQLKPGPKIIIANHPNASDYFILPLVVPEEVCYLMEPYLLEWPIAGWIHRSTGQIPVYRGDSNRTLSLARQQIEAGKTIIIMPEGEISPEGEYCQPKVGATLLALQTGVPIVPAGIFVPENYRREVKIRWGGKTRASKIQLFGPAYVRFGEAWYPPSAGMENLSRENIRQLTDLLMGKIIEQVEQIKTHPIQNQPIFESLLSLLWQRGYQQ